MVHLGRDASELVVLVVGGSRGIGRGAAEAFGRIGATVYIAARTARAGQGRWPGSIEETAAEVDRAGGTGVAVAGDVNDEAHVATLVQRIAQERRALHVVVNSAYAFPAEYPDTPRGIPFWQLPQSVWDDALGAGLTAQYRVCRHAVPLMMEGGGGLIVNISSAAADGCAFSVPYGVAKHALERMTRDMAAELSRHGICVLALRPGPVLTERIRLTPWSAEAAKAKRRSTREVGDEIVAIARRGDLMKLSGQTVTSGR